MGQIEYFGHTFKWATRGQNGQFEAIVTVNDCAKSLGLFPYRKAAWRAAKAAAAAQLEIYRKIVMIQAGMKRSERAFRSMTKSKFTTPAPMSNYSVRKTNEILTRVVEGLR